MSAGVLLAAQADLTALKAQLRQKVDQFTKLDRERDMLQKEAMLFRCEEPLLKC